jgi:hypothetical protein
MPATYHDRDTTPWACQRDARQPHRRVHTESGTTPQVCREPSSTGTWCRQMTAELTDKQRTMIKGPTAVLGNQAIDLQLLS